MEGIKSSVSVGVTQEGEPAVTLSTGDQELGQEGEWAQVQLILAAWAGCRGA